LEVADIKLDVATELIPRLAFSKEGDHWESTTSQDGSLVVAVDCTQDEAILSAGKSRELINHIQQLRKNAGLDLKDVVEVFFSEEEGVTIVEDAVAMNVAMFDAKFKGSIPLPKRFAPAYSVVLKVDKVDVGGSSVEVAICRPAINARDDIEEASVHVLSTLEPIALTPGQEYSFAVDGTSCKLQEGVDFWLSTAAKLRVTKALTWM